MNKHGIILVLIWGLSLPVQALEKTFSPILGYSPTLGTIYGVAYFEYPTQKYHPDMAWDVKLMGATKGGYQLAGQWQRWGLPQQLSVLVKPQLSTFPYTTFGLGNQTQAKNETYVDVHQIELTLETEKQLGQSPHRLYAQWHGMDWQFHGDNHPSYLKNTQDQAVALGHRYITRDDRLNPGSGVWLESQLQQLPQQARAWHMDGKHYVALTPNWVLASRLKMGRIQGDTLTTRLFDLGGADELRGVTRYRYVGTDLGLWQEELRFPVWGRVSGVAFASLGTVDWNDPWHHSYGAGLRIGLPPDQRIKIRVDMAFSDTDDSQFYVNFGHTF